MSQRNTRQREAIRTALAEADRPLGPAEICERARRDSPTLGLATVYRAIKSLVEEEAVQPVELPGEPPRYEIAGKPHHHHFHCDACGGVFEVNGCPGDLRKLAPKGYRVERHELVLYGLCDGCAAGERAGNSGASR